MPKARTPIEQLLAEQKDRRVRWASDREKQGYRRVSWYVPDEARPALRKILERLYGANGERAQLIEDLNKLAAQFVK